MSAVNTRIDECFIGADTIPAATIAVDTTTLEGTVAVGTVDIEGVSHACVVVVYPSADVAALNVSSLGSGVRNTLLSVIG